MDIGGINYLGLDRALKHFFDEQHARYPTVRKPKQDAARHPAGRE